MWRWRLNAPKRTKVLIKVLGVSLVMHCIGLLLIFVAYRGSYAHLTIDVNRTVTTPVVFMPLHKNLCVRGTKKVGNRGNNSSSKKAVQAGNGVHNLVQKKSCVVAKKSTAPTMNEKPSPTTLVSEKENKKNSVSKKQSATQKNKSHDLKKQKNKKGESKKGIEQKELKKKEDIKKVPEVKPLAVSVPLKIPENSAHISPVSVAPIAEQPVLDKAPEVEAGAAANQHDVGNGETVDGYDDDVLYVGQVEWEALQVQDIVQREIEQHWRPPVGLAPNAACDIAVTVGWHGEIAKVAVAHSSGVKAYDICARNAVRAAHFPKTAWGKEFKLHFNNKEDSVSCKYSEQ